MSEGKSGKELDQQVDNCCDKYRCVYKTIMNVVVGALFVFFCVTIANYFKPDIFGSAKISIADSQDLSAFFNSYKATIEAYHTTLLAIVALFSILGVAGAVLNMRASGKMDELTKELDNARERVAQLRERCNDTEEKFRRELGDKMKEITAKSEEMAEEFRKEREISRMLADAYAANMKKTEAGYREAIRICREIIAKDEKQATAYFHWANALSYMGKNAESIEVYRKAIAVDPENAAKYYNLGVVLGKSGDRAGAIEAFRKAIELDPEDAAAYNNLGVMLRKSGDRAGAIEAYRKAIELDPEYAAAYSNLGNVLRESGDRAGAIEAYRKAIALDPEDTAAYYNLGNVLSDSGDTAGAIEAYRKAIELDPEFAVAYNNLGVALKESGDRAGAIEAFRKAIELDLKYVAAYYNLGGALKESGDRAGAIEAYRKAIELDPKYVVAYNNLGSILIEKEEYRDAQELLLKGHELDKNSCAYNVACLYSRWSRSEKDREAKPADCLQEAEKYWRLAGENGQVLNNGIAFITADSDLDNIREQPWFGEVMGEVFGKEWEEQKGKGNSAEDGDSEEGTVEG